MKTFLITGIVVLCTVLLTFGQTFNLSNMETTIGDEPIVTITGDVNEDGLRDVILLCRPNDSLGSQMWAYVFRNYWAVYSVIDSFLYHTGIGIPEFDEPHGGVLRDINHDGHLDLIMAYSSTLEIRYGNGSGYYSTIQGDKNYASNLIGGIQIFDVDEDEWEDIICTQVSSNELLVYYSNTGVFDVSTSYVDTSSYGYHYGFDPVVAYETIDNTTAIVVGNNTDALNGKPLTYHMINHNRDKDALYYKNVYNASEFSVKSIALIQYDQDSEMEVVATSSATQPYIQIWDNDTSPSPIIATPTIPNYPNTVTVANLDCDVEQEVFIKYAINDTASIWNPHDNSMQYIEMPYSSTGLYSTQVALDDMNDDRMPELVYGSLYGSTGYQLYVYENMLGSDSVYLSVRVDSFFTLETLDESTSTNIDTLGNFIYLDTTFTYIVRTCVYYDTSDIVLRDFYCSGALTHEDILSVSWRSMSATTCSIDTNVFNASDTLLLNSDNLVVDALIRVSPNPSTGVVLFESATNSDFATAEIYNSMGMKVRSYRLTAQREWIDLSDLPPGIYMMTFPQTSWEPQKIVLTQN